MKQINTAKNYIYDLSKGDNPRILIGDFLDDFYRADSDMKQQMIDDEPETFNDVDIIYYASIAATVHKLSNDYMLEVPSWVFKKRYYLSNPFFPVDHPKLKAIYAFESPSEFKHRNIFVSANTLERV